MLGRSPLKPPHSPDDAELFRAAVADVQELPRLNRIAPAPPSRQARVINPVPHRVVADTLSDAFDSEAADEFRVNGLSQMTLRKLRRAHWPVQDCLDLHGLHSDAARRGLQEFLHHAVAQSLRCVLVIHGKGMNSASGEAVLKKRTRHWLQQHPAVLAYCAATPKEGGNGAVRVLLRMTA